MTERLRSPKVLQAACPYVAVRPWDALLRHCPRRPDWVGRPGLQFGDPCE